ncbi:transglutaminase-like cysteine peptidase [Jiella sp. CBK1P-4]|uniref:Transglutaminase-like cysteine peptidase n=2 Tax=Jiella avicenniae TaxID=2907202 RepID=A0A9X1NXF1_9HYPH|nr:transglutaminase-like cysteine peptidase [Jiella avicenniae]MCE7027287.1 transglutaminase-like cysteine peptidase [Jiella avicenniae]
MIGLLASAQGAEAAASSPMPTTGYTSQPIGHYEFCKRYATSCEANATSAALKLTPRIWARIVDVNAAVNNNIFPRTDEEIYGVAEYWAYPTSEGDCEDFALLKQYMLEREGIPASALLVTVVKQTNGDGHAVLTLRTDQGDFVLDNLETQILPWQATSYTYLKRQSANDAGKWVGIVDDRNLLVGSVR